MSSLFLCVSIYRWCNFFILSSLFPPSADTEVPEGKCIGWVISSNSLSQSPSHTFLIISWPDSLPTCRHQQGKGIRTQNYIGDKLAHRKLKIVFKIQSKYKAWNLHGSAWAGKTNLTVWFEVVFCPTGEMLAQQVLNYHRSSISQLSWYNCDRWRC